MLAGLNLADELCVMILARCLFAAAFSRRGMSSLARRKCERWLTCIWTSYPSLVASSWMAMIPALQHRTSMPSSPHAFFSFAMALFTLSNELRSQSMCSTFALNSAPASFMALRDSTARSDGRLRQMTLALLSASAIAAQRPVPVVVPVMT